MKLTKNEEKILKVLRKLRKAKDWDLLAGCIEEGVEDLSHHSAYGAMNELADLLKEGAL